MLKISKIFVQNEEFECGDINLVLGANNTGKSTFIKELLSGMQNVKIQPNNFWIKKIKINASNIKNEIEKLFPEMLNLNSFDLIGDINKNGIGVVYSIGNWSRQVYEYMQDKGNLIMDYEINDSLVTNQEFHFYVFICQLKTLQEGCNDRLNPQLSADITKLDEPYKNLVHYLYTNPLLFLKISSYIKNTFGIEIVFDDIIQGRKDIRIKPSTKSLVSQKTDPLKYSKYWQENSELLSTQGDGIKAYLKICFSLFNPSKDIIFIDEPETFLHSPQRRSLGKFISENADKGKQLFIATHDSEILRGILLSSGKNIKIFYLKDYGEKRKCHYLDVKNLSNKSRQYNEHVLNGFFNKLTVLCEAEDDRDIYQYAAQKYLPVDSVDVQFVGLNGKSEAINNLFLLRKSGINACCVFDIDALYSNEILHEDLQLPREVKVKIQSFQAYLKNLLKIGQTGRTNKESSEKFKSELWCQGVNYPLLSGKKADMLDCINELEKIGVFIIEVGHLESWFGLNKGDDKKLQKAINIMNVKRKIKLKKFLKKVIGFKIY